MSDDDDRVLRPESERMMDQLEGLLDVREYMALAEMAEPAFGDARGVQ